MDKLKTSFSNLSVLSFIAKSQSIVVAMTGNANFMTPFPSLATVTGLINPLALAQQAMDAGNYSQKDLRDSSRKVLEDALAILGAYCENVCNGDRVKLASSGFDLWKTPESAGVLPAPEGLVSELNGNSGEAFLKWKPVPNAKCYIVEATTQDPAQPESVWTIEGISTRSRFTCSGLTPAQFYSFRVSAVGSGQGNNSAPSEPATTIVG